MFFQPLLRSVHTDFLAIAVIAKNRYSKPFFGIAIAIAKSSVWADLFTLPRGNLEVVFQNIDYK